MTENDRGLILLSQEANRNYIQRVRYYVLDSMASSAIEEIRESSLYEGGSIPLDPLTRHFSQLPEDTQNKNRKLAAKIVFKSMNIAIDKGINEGVFDPREFYDSCGFMFEDAGATNPLPKPTETTEPIFIPDDELSKMRRVNEKDPTNIRFFNKRLLHLPHAMRAVFRRLGVTLIIIQDELIPELMDKLEKQGIARTYKKKGAKKVWVVSEKSYVNERKSFPRIEKRKSDRRKKGNIWSRY